MFSTCYVFIIVFNCKWRKAPLHHCVKNDEKAPKKTRKNSGNQYVWEKKFMVVMTFAFSQNWYLWLLQA